MLQYKDVRSGSTVRVVPYGVRCEVQYNDKGVLSGTYLIENDGRLKKLKYDQTVSLQKNSVVPSRVPVRKKISVQGVLYVPGQTVADAVRGADCEAGFKKFSAYSVRDEGLGSMSAPNAFSEQTLMSMCGFDVCKSFVVSDANCTAKRFMEFVEVKNQYPLVCGYYVYSSPKGQFVPETVKHSRVRSLRQHVSENGFIKCEVSMDDGSSVDVPYTQIARYSVRKGSYVSYDIGSIVYGSDVGKVPMSSASEVTCEFCGRKVHVPRSGFVKCSDPSCPSVMYPCVKHFLKTLKLPCMSYNTYSNLAKSGKFTCLLDLFLEEPYKSSRVSCTVSELLQSVCPVSCVKDRQFFDRFVKQAGSVSAVLHYVSNPDDVVRDMSSSLGKKTCDQFRVWASVPENVLTVKFMFDMENVLVVRSSLNLDVPKLMRNMNLYLHGVFKVGTYEQMCSIVESYGATVLSYPDASCTLCVEGDIPYVSDNSMDVYSLAHSYGVAVVSEREFLSHYGVYDDLESQLGSDYLL